MNTFVKSTLAVAFSLVASAALAAGDFATHDTDGDGVLSDNEFYDYVGDAGAFSQWDANNDGFLDESEFNEAGIGEDFNAWDANNDQYLGASEFYENTYDTFDENENGQWEEDEWDDAGDSGWLDV